MIEVVLELLFEVFAQVVCEVVVELFATAVGWESTDTPQDTQLWTYIACFTGGVFAGAMTLLVIPGRFTPRSPLPGVSLLLAPAVTGLVMRLLGDLWRKRGKQRPVLFSFNAGAIFAFGMALARFVYIELQWKPF